MDKETTERLEHWKKLKEELLPGFPKSEVAGLMITTIEQEERICKLEQQVEWLEQHWKGD